MTTTMTTISQDYLKDKKWQLAISFIMQIFKAKAFLKYKLKQIQNYKKIIFYVKEMLEYAIKNKHY